MKNLGLICILTFWVSVIYLVHKWPNDKSFSISRHAASDKRAYLMMAVLETIYLPLFMIFTAGWFVPTLGLSPWFTFFALLSSLGFLLGAWVPDTHGWKNKMHEFCAYGAALAMIPLVLMLTFSEQLPVIVRLISAFASAYMILGAALLRYWKSARRYHLYLQAFYIFIFHCTILSATYLR